MSTATMKTTALAGWFGANRMLAKNVGELLKDCTWVGVPFAGGMCELRHIEARSLLVNDLHRHVINLARVTAHPALGPKLYRRLRRAAFHPEELADAQEKCIAREETTIHADGLFASGMVSEGPDLEWAYDYFVTVWMARGGNAGTDGEFRGGLSLRWDAGGGDSNTRFRSATSGLMAWRRVLGRSNFTCLDAFVFLKQAKDRKGHGLYLDPPWPDAGESYRHKFPTEEQRRLAQVLTEYRQTRVVVRFGVHPLIEDLYPRDQWDWHEQTSRAQSNGDVREALIVNRA